MKKTSALIVAVLFLSAALLPAQGTFGTVNFNNRVISGGVDAPIYDMTVGGTPISGTSYLAQLYSGPAGSTEDKLVPTGAVVSFYDGLLAGYLNVGSDASRTIPNVLAGDYAVIQVRAWSAAAGSTFESAMSSGSALVKAGKSTPITVQTAPSPGGLPPFPVNLVGLSSFAVTPVPEPAMIALGTIGLLLVGMRVRSRR